MPVCPVHGSEMNISKKPGVSFYCTSKNADGSYCREAVRSPRPTSIQAPAPAPPAFPKSAVDSHDVLAAASLRFAGEIFRGAGPEMADDAIALAIKAYTALKAVA